MQDGGVRGVDALNRKDTQVNLTSPWCTPETSTLCWTNEAMAKGRKTPKINLLRRANNPPAQMMLQKPEVNFKSQLVLEVATGRRRPRYQQMMTSFIWTV